MQTVVIDANCLIHLQKGELIPGLLSLPFRFVIPEPIYDYELPYMSLREKEAFVESGLEVWVPTTDQEIRYFKIRSKDEKLSNFDYLAFIIAKDVANSILLTGDNRLRHYASRHGVEVHGALGNRRDSCCGYLAAADSIQSPCSFRRGSDRLVAYG